MRPERRWRQQHKLCHSSYQARALWCQMLERGIEHGDRARMKGEQTV
jgi:hypothetical protein